jgi:hypothetical protein
MKEEVIIEDIQIRLLVKIDDSMFSTSWYGPSDPMRFAVITSASRPYTKEEVNKYEQQAKEIFEEKIKELEEVFKKII